MSACRSLPATAGRNGARARNLPPFAPPASLPRLSLPRERAHYVGHKWGYTGNACIPMTLDDAVEQGRLQRGDVVAFCASGGGVSMASAFVRWV